jgi:hypothetical protein
VAACCLFPLPCVSLTFPALGLPTALSLLLPAVCLPALFPFFTSPLPPSAIFLSSLSSHPDACAFHAPNPHPLHACASALSTLNLGPSGRPLRFSSALSGPNRTDWINAGIVELVKFIMDAGTLVPVDSPFQPPTYYNRVVKEKLKAGKVERRVVTAYIFLTLCLPLLRL